MLIKEFYKTINLTSEETGIKATIELNPNHEVYKGHFPGQAVVPGVIQLQIVKEILENHLSKNLFMGNLNQVKYLRPIIPNQNQTIIFKINYSWEESKTLKTTVVVSALISSKEQIFTKAKINFSILF